MKIGETEYLRLIPLCIGKHFRNCPDFDDLCQTAFFGLRRGIERYDPSRGVKLEVYLYQAIRHYIGAYLFKQTGSKCKHGYASKDGRNYTPGYQHINLELCYQNMGNDSLCRYRDIDPEKLSVPFECHVDEVEKILSKIKLSPEKKRLMVLRSKGHTFPEIARMFGKRQQSVHQLYHVIIRKLRKKLKKQLRTES